MSRGRYGQLPTLLWKRRPASSRHAGEAWVRHTAQARHGGRAVALERFETGAAALQMTVEITEFSIHRGAQAVGAVLLKEFRQPQIDALVFGEVAAWTVDGGCTAKPGGTWGVLFNISLGAGKTRCLFFLRHRNLAANGTEDFAPPALRKQPDPF